MIKEIFSQFDHQNTYRDHEEIVSGHINDTYLVRTDGWPWYVLQRINHVVFRNVPGLVENKIMVSEHLHRKWKHLSPLARTRKVLSFVPSLDREFWYRDEKGNYWNMMIFIDRTKTFGTVPNARIAYEGGRLTGEFLNLTADLNPAEFIDVIPRFHDMSFRFEQFDQSLKVASPIRLLEASSYIEKIMEMKEEMHILQRLKEAGEVRIRITHNDTKISNILFDEQDNGLCMIDTDTVMPGIIHYDFGDAIRTICNTAAEDERDLSRVRFNVEFYEAYEKGFMKEMDKAMNETEKKYLPLAAKTMTFIMGLRFLTDFLNNDVYYKTKYPLHNLDRARNQFKLIDSMVESIDIPL